MTALRTTADGQQIVVHAVTATTATGLKPIRRVFDLPYVFADDGTLRQAPGIATRPGIRVSYSGFQVFPSIADLRRGRHAQSKLTVSIAGTTDLTRGALAAALGRRTSVGGDIVFDIGPAPARRIISTPARPYRHVVGITVKPVSYQLRDVPSELQNAINGLLRGLLGKPITTYFAKGVGAILAETPGPLGPLSNRVQHCNNTTRP